MRFGLYDPYLEVLGGGEKYVLTILEEVARDDDVLLMSPNGPIPRPGGASTSRWIRSACAGGPRTAGRSPRERAAWICS